MSASHVGFAESSRSEQRRPWFTRIARIGFAAKGVTYLVLAAVAVSADLDAPGFETRLLLAVLGVGLLTAAAYKLVEAFAHPDLARRDSDTAVTRVGRLVHALLYAGLAAAALDRSLHKPAAEDVHWTARLLEHSYGPELVTAVGLGAIAFGLHQLYRAFSLECLRAFDLRHTTARLRRVAVWFGGAAYAGRGIASIVVGVLLIYAAVTFDAWTTPRGLPGAFETLSHTTIGAWLIGAFAFGAVAYGLYCLLMLARYFNPRTPSAAGVR